MGAIHNELSGPTASSPSVASVASRRLRSRLLLSSAALLSALLLIPTASVADPSANQEAMAAHKEMATTAAHRGNGNPVSMSPSLLGERPNTTPSLTPLEGDQALRPLTRAAAQLKVETMSPADWLAGFGDVTVGRVDTRGLE